MLIYAYTYVRVCTCTHLCICKMYMYTYMLTLVQMCVYVHTCMYMRVYGYLCSRLLANFCLSPHVCSFLISYFFDTFSCSYLHLYSCITIISNVCILYAPTSIRTYMYIFTFLIDICIARIFVSTCLFCTGVRLYS